MKTINYHDGENWLVLDRSDIPNQFASVKDKEVTIDHFPTKAKEIAKSEAVYFRGERIIRLIKIQTIFSVPNEL